MIINDVVVVNMRKIIDERGLKQKAVAEKAKIPLNTFYAITSGRKKVDSSYIPGIMSALGVDANALYSVDDEAPASRN